MKADKAAVADAPSLIMVSQQARVRNLAEPKNIQTNLSFLAERWGRNDFDSQNIIRYVSRGGVWMRMIPFVLGVSGLLTSGFGLAVWEETGRLYYAGLPSLVMVVLSVIMLLASNPLLVPDYRPET